MGHIACEALPSLNSTLSRATSSHPAAYVADTGAAKLTLPSDIADQRQIDQLSGGRLLATGQKQSSDDHATEIIPLHSAEQGDRDSRNGHTDYGSLEGGPQIDAGSTADADRETDTATRAGGSPTFSPPASPFATADTGHLTGDGADAGSAAPLKGAAAAVAMARRKSMAESEPSDASGDLFIIHCSNSRYLLPLLFRHLHHLLTRSRLLLVSSHTYQRCT